MRRKGSIKKRQYTRWIYNARYASNTGIRVGYIYNKTTGIKEDVIRVKIITKQEIIDFNCRLDESIVIAAGLNKVASHILIKQLPKKD